MIRNHLQLAHIQITRLDLYLGNYDACNRGEFPADVINCIFSMTHNQEFATSKQCGHNI